MKKSTRSRVVPAIPLALTRKHHAARPTSAPATPVHSSGTSATAKSEDGVPATALPAAAEHRGTGPAPGSVTAAQESKGGQGEPGVERHVDSPLSFDNSPMPLSNPTALGPRPDAVPGMPSAATTGTTGTTGNSRPAASAASDSSGKQSFDMRHIGAELPPAFIPSAEQYTPHSATSSQSLRHPSLLPHAHPTHPGANQIVFGGMESGRSSPAPPPSTSSAFMPPQYPPQVPYSHAHHASEPLPPRMYQSAYHQPSAPWAMRPGFAPAQAPFPHGHVPFRPSPRDNPRHGSGALPNGHDLRSRSDSQSSAFAPDAQRDMHSPLGLDQSVDGSRIAFNSQPPRSFPPHALHPPHQFQHPDVTASFENGEALRSHMFTQFENPDLADCQLQISEEDGGIRQSVDSHKIVLARSSRLLDIIRNSAAPKSASNKTQVDITLPGRYVRVGAFADALRYLYGGPLPPFELFSLGPHASVEDRIELALQYIATGAWLNMHAFAHRGVEIATNLLHWNIITPVLEFVLIGGLSRHWPSDDGNDEKTSTCSSDDSLTKPEAGGSPTYDPFATALLTRTLDYMARDFPPNFYLDTSAPQTTACPRLPTQTPIHESKSCRGDPRLGKIRFGEHPVEDYSRPSFATTNVSSILLSLPFPLLRFLLEHPVLPSRLGTDSVASIMRTVVQEREVRRQGTLKARAASQNVEDAEPHLVSNLYWEESVERSESNRAGLRLVRRRGGIDTPPANAGTESEQNT